MFAELGPDLKEKNDGIDREREEVILSFHFKPRERRSSYEIDMTSGPLLGKIVKFAIPLALSGILQLLFNAADMVVAGRFAGSQALAAVGSTGALIQLIINLFMGLSVGVNVLVARYYGANQRKELDETVHTAILTSLVSGAVLIVIGVLLSRPLLEMMATPADVIDQSVLYMRIYFVGMPVMMLYNFGSAVLRAVGDTRRPLYFLSVAGLVNVVLNLFFVIVFDMGVAGVAVATVVSQCISAALVLLCLVRSDSVYRVDLKRLRVVRNKLWLMTKIGIPAGVQGAMFSISNVLIQSTINSFGSIAMAGSTAAGNIEGFVFTAEDSLTQASLSFAGQNFGAKKYKRVHRSLMTCMLLVTVVGLVMGCGTYLLGRPLLSIYTSDAEVIGYGLRKLLLLCVPHFTCGLMNVVVGAMRGLGASIVPMTISVFGVCVLRVVWIYTVFAAFPTWEVLFMSYPVTWLATFLIEIVCFFMVKKRAIERAEANGGPR